MRRKGFDLIEQPVHGKGLSGRLILPHFFSHTRVTVEVSGAMLCQTFQKCTKKFIKDVCMGRCCKSSDTIAQVIVHSSETKRIKSLGAKVKDGFILPDERGLCPFHSSDTGLCTAHDDKPFGCTASPFIMNPSNLLVVRNRYRRLKCYKMKCYKGKDAVPVYEAHKWSLEQIFGPEETKRIVKSAKAGEKRIKATMLYGKYKILISNHVLRNRKEVFVGKVH